MFYLTGNLINIKHSSYNGQICIKGYNGRGLPYYVNLNHRY